MLNESEIDALQVLLNHEVMLGAVAKIFEEATEEKQPVIGNEDDSVVGQKYRAYQEAQAIIGSAFVTLQNYKVDKEKDAEGSNRAI